MQNLERMLFVAIFLIGAVNTFSQNKFIMKLERAYEYNVNPEVVRSVKLYVSWVNRTTKALSGWLDTKVDLDEIYMDITATKLLSNEYRLPICRFRDNLCQAVKVNRLGIRDLYLGNGNFTDCPLKKGYYETRNATIVSSKFPPNVPAGGYNLTMDISDGKRHVCTFTSLINVYYPIQ